MGQPNMEQNPPKSPQATASSEEDNLDYDSEDDDDSRSNDSTNNQNSNISTNGSDRPGSGGGGENGGGGQHHGSGRHSAGPTGDETKRSHHNVLERKRRDLLKDSFTKLRDSVPATQPKERVSRAEILKQAADFIHARAQENARARAELDELIRKNQELETKQKSSNGASAAVAAARVVAGGTSPPASRVTGTIISSNGPKEPLAYPD